MNTADTPTPRQQGEPHAWQWAGWWLFLVALAFAALPTGLSWNYDVVSESSDGSWVLRLQWTSVFALAAWVIYKTAGWAVVYPAAKNPFVWLLLAYCVLTVGWSPEPGAVIKRSFQFFGVLLIGLSVAHLCRHDFVKLLRTGLDGLTVILFLSILAGVFVPDIGRESVVSLAGAWRGILDQKNTLGIVSAVSLFFWLVLQTLAPRRWWVASLSCLVILTCLVMSRSSTSLFLALMSMGLYLSLYRAYIRTPLAIARLVVVVMMVLTVGLTVFFFQHSRLPLWEELIEPFSALFGKSADLTGRTEIWEYMWLEIEKHWAFGLGYGSFWLGPGSPSQELVSHFYWTPNSAHNGYLEVLNELGVAGFGLFVLMLLNHLVNVIRLVRVDRPKFAFHLSLLAVFLLSNATESTALRILLFLQVVLFMSMAMVNQDLWGHDRARTPGELNNG